MIGVLSRVPPSTYQPRASAGVSTRTGGKRIGIAAEARTCSSESAVGTYSNVHPSQEERFVVLEGLYGYRIGERTGIGHPGQTVVCPVGVSHSQWNAGAGVMRVYYEHRPALESAELFFETYFGLSRDGKLLPSGDMHLLQAAVLLSEVNDFIRITSPPVVMQKFLFPVLAAIGRVRGYRARYPNYSASTVSLGE